MKSIANTMGMVKLPRLVHSATGPAVVENVQDFAHGLPDDRCLCGAAIQTASAAMCATCARVVSSSTTSSEDRWREAIASKRKRLATYAQAAVEQIPPFVRGEPDALHERIRGSGLGAVATRFPVGERSLLVVSASGEGKTTAVAAAVQRVARDTSSTAADIRKWQTWVLSSFLWTTGHDLVRARREHPLGARSDAPLVERAKKVKTLLIDEVGFEPSSEAVFEIVDFRYTHQRFTVVTSGLRDGQFRNRYGDAAFRRLTENGLGALVSAFPKAGS